MDVLIPIGYESRNGTDLRYTLRGIEKHLKSVGNVFIVGHLPAFLKDVVFIEHESDPNKAYSIMSKIYAGCKTKELSNNFIHFNDDHFPLKDIDEKFPNYYTGKLSDTLKGKSRSGYSIFGYNTLEALGEGALDFNLHCPMIYNKKKFIKTMDSYDWTKGYLIKSLYANHNNLTPTPYTELKINTTISPNHIRLLTKDRMFFSVGEFGMTSHMIQYLEELYPVKSRWEK